MREIVFLKERCTTCGACAAACGAEHGKNHRLYDRIASLPMGRKRGSDAPGEEAVVPAHAARCRHCEEPACLEACISGAFGKRDRVFTRWDRCVGCFMCVMNCPFGAILPFHDKAVKCDACLFTEKPACVRACPQNALLFEEEAGPPAGTRPQAWKERRQPRTSFLKSRYM